MVPALARGTIETSSERGDPIIDPIYEIGTTIVETPTSAASILPA
jgi:hypothetical protein